MPYTNRTVEASLRGKRILIVDDQLELANMVKAILNNAGFEQVLVAQNGAAALALVDKSTSLTIAKPKTIVAERPFHLFILDVMMPDVDGFELLAQLYKRPACKNAPALFLTAKDEPFDRVNGLALGADDYVTKPFLPQELVLRIAAVLRRCYSNEQLLLELDACYVNFDTAEVVRADGQTAMLTAKEHEILGVLTRNIGRIITIDSLCEACWGTSFGYENSLMTHIRRLREKTETNPSKPTSIITVKGLGYKLVARG